MRISTTLILAARSRGECCEKSGTASQFASGQVRCFEGQEGERIGGSPHFSLRRDFRHGLLVASALCMAAVPAAAQSITGAIVGRVTDPSDAVIVGASVRAINAATGAVDATATGDTGFYRIANLLPGEYFVEVEASGFQTARVSAQRLSLADSLRLDVKLELGETEFSVTVEAIASEVNTEDAQLGKVMRDIARLPVLSTVSGRNVLFLVLTQPGVAPGPRGVSFNGQRSRQNHTVIDGATTNYDGD